LDEGKRRGREELAARQIDGFFADLHDKMYPAQLRRQIVPALICIWSERSEIAATHYLRVEAAGLKIIHQFEGGLIAKVEGLAYFGGARSDNMPLTDTHVGNKGSLEGSTKAHRALL
jgi:hypothetical protein